MTIEDKFFERVFILTEDRGCWLWVGKTNSSGYGSMKINGKETIATRISLELFKGKAPPGKPFALHTCRVRGCVNPQHLYWGTKKENTADAIRAGTFFFSDMAGRRGESAWNAVLSNQDVIDIRNAAKLGFTHESISKRFGICRQSIGTIINRTKWSHVLDPPPQSTTAASQTTTTQ